MGPDLSYVVLLKIILMVCRSELQSSLEQLRKELNYIVVRNPFCWFC